MGAPAFRGRLLAVVGIGSSTPPARTRVDDAVRRLARHPHLAVVGESPRYENPAWGGATLLPFVNAAVVVRTALAPEALLRELQAVEHAAGRVRTVKNAARTLDLDLLLAAWEGAPLDAPLRLRDLLELPHPRLWTRAFAARPARDALRAAGLPIPARLAAAQLDERALQPLP